MKKYILIDTYNGEGYSDSKAKIVETENPKAYAEDLARQSAGPNNLVFASIYGEIIAWTYDIGENSGAITIIPVPNEWVAIRLMPMVNYFNVVADEEELNTYIDAITEFSEEYKEDGELFGTIHHNILDEDVIIFVKSKLEEEVELNSSPKEQDYNFEAEADEGESEIWIHKVTGKTIKVPVELVRDWSNAVKIDR